VVKKMLKTGNQLRAARVLVGMTQEEVAERAGVHLNTISAMERRGERVLTSAFDVVDRVSQALERAGVIFLYGNGRGPGVVLRDLEREPVAPTKRAGVKAGGAKKPRPRRSDPQRPAAW
jgi:transcriptional regulator with XRE-family HTH domain